MIRLRSPDPLCLAMKEVEYVVQQGIKEAIINSGKTVWKGGRYINIPTIVRTEHSRFEIVVVWDNSRKMYKLIHFREIR